MINNYNLFINETFLHPSFNCFFLLPVSAQTSVWKGEAVAWTTGDGSLDNPYLIESAGNLAYLSQQVVNGTFYRDKYFLLTTNIDLNNLEWMPIGGRNTNGESLGIAFEGIFDGNNKKISNLKINAPDKDMCALFGYLFTNPASQILAEVKNLSIISGEIYGKEDTAGIVGFLTGRIRNCSNAATIKGKYEVAGIVGTAKDIIRMGSGGVGASTTPSEIIGCTNIGTIMSEDEAGGIVNNAFDCLIQHCSNSGSVSGSSYGGGIACMGSGLITHCINRGSIYGNRIGGIISYDESHNLRISSCINAGTINKGEKSYMSGGIASIIENSGSVIVDCYNIGGLNINGGGIVGEIRAGRVENCYNIGKLPEGTSKYNGAIAGEVTADKATITNCYYLENVIAENNGYGTSKTATEMKAVSFVTTLNASQKPITWKKGGSSNNGYPVLIPTPYLLTLAAINITDTSATLRGVIETGSAPAIKQGFRYRKADTDDYKTVDAKGAEMTTVIICDPLTDYLFQTYAETEAGSFYGKEMAFTTKGKPSGIEDFSVPSVNVYPNPTRDYIVFSLVENSQVNILYIYSTEGYLQEKITLTDVSETFTLDVRSYKKGLYLYKLGKVVGKFIVN